jgi:hypothetical protein
VIFLPKIDQRNKTSSYEDGLKVKEGVGSHTRVWELNRMGRARRKEYGVQGQALLSLDSLLGRLMARSEESNPCIILSCISGEYSIAIAI